MLNVSADTVRRVCGPGAVCPEATPKRSPRKSIWKWEAEPPRPAQRGARGRNMTQLASILHADTGHRPAKWLAKQMPTRMDRTLDIEERTFTESSAERSPR